MMMMIGVNPSSFQRHETGIGFFAHLLIGDLFCGSLHLSAITAITLVLECVPYRHL